MARRAKEFKLGEEIHKEVLRLSKRRHGKEHIKERSNIILHVHDGCTTKEIMEALDVSDEVVSRWRNRMHGALPRLELIAANDPKKLKAEVYGSLDDLPRSGRPRTIPGDFVAWITKAACHPPREYGIEANTWTCELPCSNREPDNCQHLAEDGVALSS